MAAAKDGNRTAYRSQTKVYDTDDHHDDAADVRSVLFIVPKRPGALLGNIEYNKHCNSVFCRRLGLSQYADEFKTAAS